MSELMMQGLNLALVGMGVVFTFLAVLVGLTTLMSAIVARFPATDAALGAVGGEPRRTGTARDPQDDQRLVAVITAAIRQHRNLRQAPEPGASQHHPPNLKLSGR